MHVPICWLDQLKIRTLATSSQRPTAQLSCGLVEASYDDIL
jgi:hypothetical protein